MTNLLYKLFSAVKRLRSLLCTAIFKRMIHSYGPYLGVNSFSTSSRHALVDVGSHVNFNGVRIIGVGGKNR